MTKIPRLHVRHDLHDTPLDNAELARVLHDLQDILSDADDVTPALWSGRSTLIRNPPLVLLHVARDAAKHHEDSDDSLGTHAERELGRLLVLGLLDELDGDVAVLLVEILHL